MAHPCDACGFQARTASGLKSHQRAKHPPERHGPIAQAVDQAVAGARHLTPMDQATVEVLRRLARTIDGMEDRDADAPMDNVTIPTFLKYSMELGLTPLARLKLGPQEAAGGKLAQLRAVRGGKAS